MIVTIEKRMCEVRFYNTFAKSERIEHVEIPSKHRATLAAVSKRVKRGDGEIIVSVAEVDPVTVKIDIEIDDNGNVKGKIVE